MVKDSTASELYYFIGSASDDYALTKLKFVFEQVNEQGITVHQGSEDLPLNITSQTDYDYIMNVADYELKPGDKLNYYFEVYDLSLIHI